MMHGTTEALSSGMPFDGRALPLPAFSPNRLRTEPSAAPLPPAVALTSQTAGAEADATRPPLDELTWDDLYISQELRTAYFYYKLGVSRLMNNQQSFLVATLKQNNCPVLSHEQIAAIQMKQDPLDWKSFHLRPSKWSTKYYTSTELHRAYMYYSEELSRFSHVGRSAQQMEKALNSAECPVLTRYEIADIQRRRKREMQAAATAVGSPDGQAQPSVLRKRRVVRRRTGLVDSDVVLPARTRKRAPVSPADSEEDSKVPSFGQSLQEFAAPRPMKRVRQTRPVQRPASPVASYSSLAESPLNSLSLLPSFSFTPIQQQHYPAPAPAQLPHFPLPEYPYALPSAPSFLAQAPMAQPPAPSHGMVVGSLSLSGSDDLMGSPFKFFENDPFFSLQNEPANPQSPLSVSSAEWDSGHSDLSHSPVGGSPIDDLMASPSNVAALTLPSSVVPAPVQMSGYPMQPMPTSMPMPLQLSVPVQQQFTFSDLAGMSQPTQYQSQTQAYQQQYQSQSRQSFVPPPQYAIAPDQSFGLLDGVVGWN